MYSNDIALISEDGDMWAHRVNTPNNHWTIVNKSYIVNLYKDSLVQEFNKLIDYYNAQVAHDSCPYAQTVETLQDSMSTMQHYGHSVIDESANFFQIEDFKQFISDYIDHGNLIEFTSELFTNHLDL
jgi:hypothetical protein